MFLLGWILLLKQIGPWLALVLVGAVMVKMALDRADQQFASMLRRAFELGGYTVCDWSIDLGYSNHAHASRMFSGERPIGTRHLAVLPLQVRQWLWLLMAQREGLPPETHTARRIQERTA